MLRLAPTDVRRGISAQKPPSISPPSENANGPGNPEAVARTDKSVPRQGHPHYRDSAATNQVTLRRVAPRPANPPLVPERQSFQRRNGPGGIRTLARTLTGSCAAITPQVHDRSLGQCGTDLTFMAQFCETRVSFWEGEAASAPLPHDPLTTSVKNKLLP